MVVAFVASLSFTHKAINRLGKFFKVTKQLGETDIWDYLHKNSNYQWFVVRDLKFDLAYFGWIEAFSDSGDKRELLMREVDVYSNSTGVLLYKSDALYISRDQYDLSIEAPNLSDESPINIDSNRGDKDNGQAKRSNRKRKRK